MRAYFAARGWILAAALLALLIARGASDAPLRPAWLLFVLAGIFLRAWAGAHLGGHGNAARAQAPILATSGPYRLSRNPLYLSNLIVATGLILYANALPSTVAALFVLAIALHHALLVRHEESALAERFGDTYDAYRHGTARWIGIPREEKTGRAESGVPLRATWVRQGRNVVYALACALLVWVAAGWF